MLNPYHYLNPKTWLKDRYNGIGASEFAILCQQSTYKTPLELHTEKVNKKAPEVSEETQKLFDAGHTQEPITLFKACKKYNLPKANKMYRKHLENLPMGRSDKVQILTEFHDPLDNFIFAHPDMIAKLGRRWVNFQAKYIRHRGAWDFHPPFTEDQIPMHVYIQVQGEMMVTGINHTIVCANYQGADFYYYPINVNKKLFPTIRKLCFDFWTLVNENTPPPARSREDALKLFPKKNFKALTLDENMAIMTILQKDKYKQLSKRKTAIDKLMKSIKADVMALGAEYNVIQTPEGDQIGRFSKSESEGFCPIGDLRKDKRLFNYCIKNKIIVPKVSDSFRFT